MTSFIERKVNEICGRWLDGFTKNNVDVSVLQAKITLSDLYFKTDELCLLSPTLAPTFFYVGKLSVDIPLAFSLDRRVKITVSDVFAVLRVGGHGLTPEDVRKSVSANAHVKALLSRLASEMGGSVVDEERQASTISLKTALAVYKVLQNIEISIKGAHIRLEEPEIVGPEKKKKAHPFRPPQTPR